MKLYYAPGACSVGIHVLLEEIGKPYEAQKLALRDGEQHKPPFVEKNPKSKVPTLERDDGSVLTEFPAIALWLARTNPEKNLLPNDPDAEARAFEALDYCVATLHMQGFSRMFRPSATSAPNEGEHEAVKARGKEIMEKGLALARQAARRQGIPGRCRSRSPMPRCSTSSSGPAARAGITLPPNCAAHYARMKARPAVQRVIEKEGIPA